MLKMRSINSLVTSMMRSKKRRSLPKQTLKGLSICVRKKRPHSPMLNLRLNRWKRQPQKLRLKRALRPPRMPRKTNGLMLACDVVPKLKSKKTRRGHASKNLLLRNSKRTRSWIISRKKQSPLQHQLLKRPLNQQKLPKKRWMLVFRKWKNYLRLRNKITRNVQTKKLT